MSSRLSGCLLGLVRSLARHGARPYATVESPVIVSSPPPPPKPNVRSALDDRILEELSKGGSSDSRPNLADIIHQYHERAGIVLDSSLPYESRPGQQRKVNFDSSEKDEVSMLAHCVQEGGRHKITLSSAWALNVSGGDEGESVIVSCAHTLEEIRGSPLLVMDNIAASAEKHTPPLPGHASGTFLLSGTGGQPTVRPVSSILSALPRSDLVVFSAAGQSPIKTLPVSPYPAHPSTAVRAHFVVDNEPEEDGWTPWIGGTWSKWVRGNVLGYRDFAGREAKPGTYDALSNLYFNPPPTAGSSGGPIVDEESGCVVGVMRGTRMDSAVEGVRGWGVPSEAIFEMFCLPGLGKK